MPIITTDKADPGAMGNDALICAPINGRWVPVAGICDAHMMQGKIYGVPIWRDPYQSVFKFLFNNQSPIELRVTHDRFGEIIGGFRIVSLEDDELALKQVD